MRNAARVVDDGRARGAAVRCPLDRERVVDVDDHEVEPVEAAVAQAPRTRPRRPANGELAAPSAVRRVHAQLA